MNIKNIIIAALSAYTSISIYNSNRIINNLETKIQKIVNAKDFEKIKDKAASIFSENKIVSLQKALDSLNFRNKIFQNTRYKDELKKNYDLGFTVGKKEGLHKGDSIGMAVGRYLGFVNGLKDGIFLGKGLKDDSIKKPEGYNLGWEKESTVNFIMKHLNKYKDSIDIYYNDNLMIVPTFQISKKGNVKNANVKNANVKNVNVKKPNVYKNNSTYKPGAKPKGKTRI